MDSVSNTYKVIKHILITGTVGDTIGLGLKDLYGSERTSLYQKTVRLTKSTLPKTPIPGEHGTVMLGIFNALRKNKKVTREGSSYEALLFGGAVGVGLYGAYYGLDMRELFVLLHKHRLDFMIEAEDTSLFVFLGWIVWMLVYDGYLRGVHLTRAIELCNLSPALVRAFDRLNTYQFDRRMMTMRIAPADLLVDLTPYEQSLVKVLYYLFQSFSGWTSKPRFALDGVVTHDPSCLYEIMFLFSVLCVASEHNYLLYTQPLQDQNVYTAKIKAIFGEEV